MCELRALEKHRRKIVYRHITFTTTTTKQQQQQQQHVAVIHMTLQEVHQMVICRTDEYMRIFLI